MKQIVRIWVYKSREELKLADCKISRTNQLMRRVVRGDFEHYEMDGHTVRKSNRREADAFAQKNRRKVKTWVGYPYWMKDMGYKA